MVPILNNILILLENGWLFTRIFFGLRLIPDFVRVVHIMVEMSLFDYMLCFLSQGVSELSVKRIGQLLSLLGGKMLKELR